MFRGVKLVHVATGESVQAVRTPQGLIAPVRGGSGVHEAHLVQGGIVVVDIGKYAPCAAWHRKEENR